MMIILVCQIGGAIAGFVYARNIAGIAEVELRDSMTRYNDADKGGVKKSWDLLQVTVRMWSLRSLVCEKFYDDMKPNVICYYLIMASCDCCVDQCIALMLYYCSKLQWSYPLKGDMQHPTVLCSQSRDSTIIYAVCHVFGTKLIFMYPFACLFL